jgi:type I restriction enzyme S subunit
MSSNRWETYKLQDLCSYITDGKHGDCKSQENSGYYFLSVKDVFDGRLHYENARQITKEDFEDTHKRTRLEAFDILLTNSGTIGRMALVPDNELTSRTTFQKSVAILKPIKEKVFPPFLYYCLLSRKSDIVNTASGTTQQNLLLGDLRSFKVEVPKSIETQRRIADILSALDEKIELNRQINATLEAIAQAIFREWFVEFNFPLSAPRLEGLQDYHDYAVNRQGNQANQENQGKDMVESELSPIPRGWRVGKLGEIVEVKGGTTPSTKEEKYWNGEYYFATPKDLSNLNSPILLDTERKITREGVSQISSGILPAGTLLLSSRAPIGYLAISNIPVSINQGFIAINAKETSNLFVLHWLRENMETVISRANGSTFLEITKTNFKDIELVIPDAETINRFEEIVSPIFEQIRNNEQQSATLATLRDALLPKLMSGEMEVMS